MKEFLTKNLRKLGYEISGVDSLSDLTEQERAIVRQVMPFTMTSMARIAAVVTAVRYLVTNNIRGDIAECGVWRGGSMMAAALTLRMMGTTDRTLYLYDTFEGMTIPTDSDVSHRGELASELQKKHVRGSVGWCHADITDVKKNLLSTGYPDEKIVFIKGPVEQTIPENLPSALALLRLDTDWYESTIHEMTHLYPLLAQRGVLIVDDYGHWQGAKKAIDEYFSSNRQGQYLHRIDYTGRITIKLDPPR